MTAPTERQSRRRASAAAKIKPIVGIRFVFSGPDGQEIIEEFSIAEWERMLLDQAIRATRGRDPIVVERSGDDSCTSTRELGEAMLEQIAEGLAKNRDLAVRQKLGSDRGAEKRRKIGDDKAWAVQAAVDKGNDPLNLVSDRQLRRIKKRNT